MVIKLYNFRLKNFILSNSLHWLPETISTGNRIGQRQGCSMHKLRHRYRHKLLERWHYNCCFARKRFSCCLRRDLKHSSKFESWETTPGLLTRLSKLSVSETGRARAVMPTTKMARVAIEKRMLAMLSVGLE